MPTTNYFKSSAKNKYQSYSTQRNTYYTDSLVIYDTGEDTVDIPFSSNVSVLRGALQNSMINLGECNTINVAIDNTHQNQDLKLEMKYGFYDDSANSHIKFTTEIPKQTFQYLNYPPKGNFVTASLENPATSPTGNVSANVSIQFSKYTQYNTHGQSSDTLNQYQMVQFGRQTNDYVDDIVLNRYDDRDIENQAGYRDNWNNTGNAVVWDADEAFPIENYITEYYQQLHVTSSDASDNQRVVLQGTRALLSVRNEGFSEEITLNGTSNVTTTLDFRALNKAFIASDHLTNTGTIEFRGALNGTLYNVIPAGAGETSASIYTQQKDRQSVIKEWQLMGDTGGTGAGDVEFNLFILDGITQRRIRKIAYDHDTQLTEILPINQLLTEGQVVYATVGNAQSDTQIQSNLVIREYDDSV